MDGTTARATEDAKPLVLVVDDFDDAREMCRDILAYGGFRVAMARDGEEAVKMARELRPALVIMDLAMPRMDGCEATRKIKADERTRDIPVIALTGYSYELETGEATKAGCDEVLIKPCLPDRLLKAVRERVRVRRESR